jgi:hypothetical protein
LFSRHAAPGLSNIKVVLSKLLEESEKQRKLQIQEISALKNEIKKLRNTNNDRYVNE